MKAKDAASNQQNSEKRKAHVATFAKVLDGRKQPIRGLWIRGTRYYARLNVENPLTGIKKNQRVPRIHSPRIGCLRPSNTFAKVAP